MLTFWQHKLHLLTLFVLIVSIAAWPAGPAAGMQSDGRLDAYGLTVEDGEYIYVVGDAVGQAGRLPAGSLDQSGGMLDLWVAKLRRDGTPVFQAVIGGQGDDIASAVAVRQGVIYIAGETWSRDFPGAPGGAGENDALILAVAADGGSVLWARRFGGSDQDASRAITLRGSDLYLAGITWSMDFQPGLAKGDADGFLARLDLSGNLKWLKVLGGRGMDAPFSLAAGSTGIWVAGETFSPNLAGAPLGEGDIFALRFDEQGGQQFAGLYGGTGDDVAYAAALAPDGRLYLTGSTQSADLPGAKGTFGGGMDGFLMQLGADGKLNWTLYLGGSEQDAGMALAVLPDGSALAAGSTRSGEFPRGYALTATSLGGEDAFLAQASLEGDLVYAGLWGAAQDDHIYGLGLTASGVALAGRFSAGDPDYLLLAPSEQLPGVKLPTTVPPAPTATTAHTATPWPTETQGPAITPALQQPTVDGGSGSVDSAVQAAGSTPAVTESTAAAAESTLAVAEAQPGVTQVADNTSAGAENAPQAVPTASTTPINQAGAAAPTVIPMVQPETASAPISLGAWAITGLVLIAGILGGAFWLQRKQRGRVS